MMKSLLKSGEEKAVTAVERELLFKPLSAVLIRLDNGETLNGELWPCRTSITRLVAPLQRLSPHVPMIFFD